MQQITDSDGREWSVGPRLGHGLWASAYLVSDATGAERVLKLAHTAEDLPDVVNREAAAALCIQCADEFVSKTDVVLGRVQTSGRAGVFLPRYPASLAERGTTLRCTLEAVARLSHDLGTPHGNLSPENILLTNSGEPIASDPFSAVREALRGMLGTPTDGRPPEAKGAPDAGWDTWAICAVVWRNLHPDTPLPPTGIDRIALSALRDRAMERLQREGANPRFLGRATQKLGAVLARGLSAETAPSPPYRFGSSADLASRLADVVALLSPQVVDVGSVLLGSSADNGVFSGSDSVDFTVNVATSSGLDDHEDLACGVKLRDLDASDEGRVVLTDTRYDVKRHASGRMRFHFTLPDVRPGRYELTVAFSVKDGNADPIITSGSFEVRPPPGYVPPADPEPISADPLTFPSERQSAPHLEAEPPSSPGELVEGFFPQPVSPPTSPGAEPEPIPLRPAQPIVHKPARPMPPPPLAAVPTAPPSVAETDVTATIPVVPPSADTHPTLAPDLGAVGVPGPAATDPTGLGDGIDIPIDFSMMDDLPVKNMGEDLPTWETSSTKTPYDHAIDILRHGGAIAIMLAIGACFTGLVLLLVLLRACA
jgi:hypothetical protein